MTPTERALVMERIRPHVPASHYLRESGQALVLDPIGQHTEWFTLDCPSHLGSGFGRARHCWGTVDAIPGLSRGGVWTEVTPYRSGPAWVDDVIADFRRVVLPAIQAGALARFRAVNPWPVSTSSPRRT